MSAAVTFERVGFSYGAASEEGEPREAVLRDVTFSVPRGQCVVVTGASGCGKTTLTRLVNGLVPFAYEGVLEGSVLVDGRSPEDWGTGELARRVGSVFQNPRSQCFNLDTTSEVAFCCENLGFEQAEVRARVSRALDDLGIAHLLDCDMRALSGGQRQMVAIASAYAAGPDLFVLDEPTASLDTAAMRTLAAVVARLKELGKTVIVSEHRLWWLSDVADRVLLMENGRITCDWTPGDLAALSDEERQRRGLRARDVSELARVAQEFPRSASDVRSPAAEEPACLLEARGVRTGYRRGSEVLRGVDVRLQAGRIVALVGRNGAGKTTLARLLAGLHRERAGEVLLDGARTSCRRRAGRAYLVMQEPGYQLFSDSVLGEVAGEGSAESGEGVQVLERFGLSGLAGRHPLSLSGGERQRLAIAAGCAQQARVIVLDEPTSGLDYANMQRVARELRALGDAGASVLVITHDYEFLAQACDAALELEGGCVKAGYVLDDASRAHVMDLFGFDA